MHIITQTPRLVIREFLPAEEAAYLKHFKDKQVCLYIPKRTRDERIHIFRTAIDNYNGNKKLGIWGMFGKTNGDLIGSCLLRPFDNEQGKIELGYSMSRKYWGKGIGTEMAIAMVAFAFASDDAKTVVAVTDMRNIGSQRVLEKAGFKRLDNLTRNDEELAYFEIKRNIEK